VGDELPRDLEALAAAARSSPSAAGPAMAALLAASRERVYRWALVRTGDPDDADDVAQEVSMALHRRLGQFGGRSRFSTWLYRMAANAAAELHRRSRRRSEVHGLASDETVTAALDEQIAGLADRRIADTVRGFFATLPDRQRELVDLVDLQGYTAAQAAEMLEIEPATARTHLFRGRRALRERLLETYPTLREDR
jgi:RNA polymerase sigma-70 factor (ECF subfamily)